MRRAAEVVRLAPSAWALAAALALPVRAEPRPPVPPGAVPVPRAAILAAIQAEQGFDRRQTTNQSRLQSHVFLRLCGSGGLAEGGLAYIDHEDWFQAYLEAVGLKPDEAPLSVRLSHEHRYDVLLDARPAVVVERVRAGPQPLRALNVRWRARSGDDEYSYRDTLSRPVLEMSFEATVTYRLLELPGFLAFDEIEGVSGRPVTGPFSLLFKLIGRAQADWSRSALAADGWQVVLARAHKGFFSRTAAFAIPPDGKVERDIPPARADLLELERRLRQPLDVDYKPWRP